MDFGLSMNPNMDIGPIKGAFMQEMGMVTIDELIRGEKQLKWVETTAFFAIKRGSVSCRRDLGWTDQFSKETVGPQHNEPLQPKGSY